MFDDVTSCQALSYLGGPKCGYPLPNVPTAVNFYPSKEIAILHSSVGYQKLHVHKGGQVIFEQEKWPKDWNHGILTKGWTVQNGQVTFRGKMLYGCVGVAGDHVFRLFVDLWGDVVARPGCKEMKILVQPYQAPPPTEKYWYPPE